MARTLFVRSENSSDSKIIDDSLPCHASSQMRQGHDKCHPVSLQDFYSLQSGAAAHDRGRGVPPEDARFQGSLHGDSLEGFMEGLKDDKTSSSYLGSFVDHCEQQSHVGSASAAHLLCANSLCASGRAIYLPPLTLPSSRAIAQPSRSVPHCHLVTFVPTALLRAYPGKLRLHLYPTFERERRGHDDERKGLLGVSNEEGG